MRHRIRQLNNNRFVVEEKQERLWKVVYKCNHRGLFGYCEAERWIKAKERKVMKDKKIYRIVCSPNEVWSVQEMVETDYRSDWMEAYRCTAQGEAGYNEAKKWIKENDK